MTSVNAHILHMTARHRVLGECAQPIQDALTLLGNTFAAGGKVLLCGNGGSAADCEHIVGELMKAFLRPRPLPEPIRAKLESAGEAGALVAAHLQGGLPCVALTSHPALNLAIANDVRADMAFAQQTYALGRPGDLLWGISTSGNSANVFHAFEVARVIGLRTLALTGAGGGKLKTLADAMICVPASTVVEIQELHLPVYHCLCAALEERFFGK